MRRIVTAAVAALAATTLATAASAAVTVTTFKLDVSEAFSGISSGIGTVTVTDNGVDLFIKVALDTGWEFRDASDAKHHDLTFDLQDTPGHQLNGVTVQNLTSTFHQDPGTAFDNTPFKNFNYAIDCNATACTRGWPSPSINSPNNPTELSFKLAGISESKLASVPYTPHNSNITKNIFFAVDVQRFGGNTGAVGATFWNQVSYAPEPSTWAMMILGFGCIGADLRRRRRASLAA